MRLAPLLLSRENVTLIVKGICHHGYVTEVKKGLRQG